MDATPAPLRYDLPTTCIPGCIADHSEALGAWYCYTAPTAIDVATGRTGVYGSVEVAADRCVGDGPRDPVGTPHQVTVEVPDTTMALTPAAARAFALALWGNADRVERTS